MSDQLRAVVSAGLRDLGVDVEAVELTPAGKHRVLRVAIDQDGGVGIDDLAAATRVLSQALDESDVMGSGPYTLEVTSRGVDRPLTLPRHWRRNRDRLVRVTLTDGRTLTGRIGDSDDHSVAISSAQTRQVVAFADIVTAVVQIELNRKDR